MDGAFEDVDWASEVHVNTVQAGSLQLAGLIVLVAKEIFSVHSSIRDNCVYVAEVFVAGMEKSKNIVEIGNIGFSE